MHKHLYLLIQFLPLSVFALFAYWNGDPSGPRWVVSFQLGALLAAAQLALLLVLKPDKPLNRLILAANLYLLLGGVAATAGWWNIMSIYANAMESGILGLMVVTGVVATFFTKGGFVGVAGIDRRTIRLHSLILLLANVVAFLASLLFSGDRLLAAVLPILGLAIVHRILVYRLEKPRIQQA